MKNRLKAIILVLIALNTTGSLYPFWGFFSANSCPNQIVGSKKFATKTIDFNGPVNNLSISSIIKCSLKQGQRSQLEITANENILERVNVSYKNNKLVLELDSDSYQNIDINCTLTTPQLPHEINASGNSRIIIDHDEKQTNLDLNLSGNNNATILRGIFNSLTAQLSGNVTLKADRTQVASAQIFTEGNATCFLGTINNKGPLTLQAHGHSKIDIKNGSPVSLQANVSGNSSIKAPNMTMQQATISASGNSSVTIGTVFKNMNARAAGMSSISFNALANTKIFQNTSGLATIKKR